MRHFLARKVQLGLFVDVDLVYKAQLFPISLRSGHALPEQELHPVWREAAGDDRVVCHDGFCIVHLLYPVGAPVHVGVWNRFQVQGKHSKAASRSFDLC